MGTRSIAVLGLASVLAAAPVGFSFTRADGSLQASVGVREACGAEPLCFDYDYMICWYFGTGYPGFTWDWYESPCEWC
jgi:hypothetical protein